MNASGQDDQSLRQGEGHRSRRDARRIGARLRHVLVVDEELLEEPAKSHKLRYLGLTDGAPHCLKRVAHLPVIEELRFHAFFTRERVASLRKVSFWPCSPFVSLQKQGKFPGGIGVGAKPR